MPVRLKLGGDDLPSRGQTIQNVAPLAGGSEGAMQQHPRDALLP